VNVSETEVGSKPGQLQLVSEPDINQQLRSSLELAGVRADQTGGNGNGLRKLAKRFSDDGMKIEAEREDNGVTWRYESRRARPHDNRHIVAGKIYRNDQLLISMESVWDTVAGVDFVRQRATSFYTSGHLVLRRVVTVDPTAVSKASPRSTVQIDPLAKKANDLGPDSGCPTNAQCICDDTGHACILLGPGAGGQAALTILDDFWNAVGGALDNFNYWVAQFWAHGDANAISGLADAFIGTYQAVTDWSVAAFINLLVTVGSQADLLFVADELATWAFEHLWMFGGELME
jgi:hypothetical protein